MTNAELIAKADRMEPLTVSEIKRYRKLVKPNVELACGKYGTLKKNYLEERGTLWLIPNIPEYLQKVDEQARIMYESLENKLSKCEQYKRTGDYLEDVRRISAMQKAIEEEILAELICTDEV